jgi:hypothetical protein
LFEHDLSATATGRWLRGGDVAAKFLPKLRAGAMSAR